MNVYIINFIDISDGFLLGKLSTYYFQQKYNGNSKFINSKAFDLQNLNIIQLYWY